MWFSEIITVRCVTAIWAINFVFVSCHMNSILVFCFREAQLLRPLYQDKKLYNIFGYSQCNISINSSIDSIYFILLNCIVTVTVTPTKAMPWFTCHESAIKFYMCNHPLIFGSLPWRGLIASNQNPQAIFKSLLFSHVEKSPDWELEMLANSEEWIEIPSVEYHSEQRLSLVMDELLVSGGASKLEFWNGGCVGVGISISSFLRILTTWDIDGRENLLVCVHNSPIWSTRDASCSWKSLISLLSIDSVILFNL